MKILPTKNLRINMILAEDRVTKENYLIGSKHNIPRKLFMKMADHYRLSAISDETLSSDGLVRFINKIGNGSLYVCVPLDPREKKLLQNELPKDLTEISWK